jgi:hypothetical protein
MPVVSSELGLLSSTMEVERVTQKAQAEKSNRYNNTDKDQAL